MCIKCKVYISTLLHPVLLPPQGVVPTLRDLSLLPVPDWYLLGLQLGISADDLDVIERNYPRDNHICKVKMFGAWLRMDTSASYRKLSRALVAVGKRNIAEAMCTARGTEVTALEGSCVYCNVQCVLGRVEKSILPNSALLNVYVKTNYRCCMLTG